MVEQFIVLVLGVILGAGFVFLLCLNQKQQKESPMPKHVKGLDKDALDDLFLVVVREQAMRSGIVKDTKELDEQSKKDIEELRILAEISKKERFVGELAKLVLESSLEPIWVDRYFENEFVLEFENIVMRDEAYPVESEALNAKKAEAVEKDSIVILEDGDTIIEIVPFDFDNNKYIYGCIKNVRQTGTS